MSNEKKILGWRVRGKITGKYYDKNGKGHYDYKDATLFPTPDDAGVICNRVSYSSIVRIVASLREPTEFVIRWSDALYTVYLAKNGRWTTHEARRQVYSSKDYAEAVADLLPDEDCCISVVEA